MVRIEITSNNSLIRTPNGVLTQEQLVEGLRRNVEAGKVVSTEIKRNDFSIISFIFKEYVDAKANVSKNLKEIDGIEIVIQNNNLNTKKIKRLAKKCPHTSYVSNKLLVKSAAFVLAGAMVATAGAYAIKGISKTLIDIDNANFEAETNRINQMYMDENGNDVRQAPWYSDNGRFIDNNHYVDENGIKYVISTDGKWFEMGSVVYGDMTQEEYDEYLNQKTGFTR